MAATPALARELTERGFDNVVLWPRGVDTHLFHPRAIDLCLPAPVFLSVGRVAVEKNLEAFLDLDLPGTKVIVGDGPGRIALEEAYPDAIFLGEKHGEELADIYAAADVFVFPSKTDTFGLVLLEALASGLPVAAFPVKGPRDVIGDAPVGVLDHDLRSACFAPRSTSPGRTVSNSPPTTPGKPRPGILSTAFWRSARCCRAGTGRSRRASSPERKKSSRGGVLPAAR
ncbi:hypothetical protein ACVWW2_006061 [Bradyrhizobium sp. LM4.3]